ncbi:MAG: Xaa-Pro dipeptidase [Acidobacteria bacterium]|nr:Xaa-Pro dipeptidase [Acidobacteriota bacterium]
MAHEELFARHFESMTGRYADAIGSLSRDKILIDAVLIHSGSEGVYFADDQHMPFRSFAHFLQWLPVDRPDQMILFQPGKKPTYFQVVPKDFWYEQSVVVEEWWAQHFDIVPLSSADEVIDQLPPLRRIAFLGESTGFAATLGLPSSLHNEPRLRSFLDYHRAVKTEYEVERIREASVLGVDGHRAAREKFEKAGSEWDIHMAFLETCRITEFESPYPNIVALDEKGAILHYQNRRTASGRGSKVLLIDAGCRVAGYCSDITRTYTRDGASPVFKALIDGVEKIELGLVPEVKAGRPYPELHAEAHRRIAALLRDTGLCTASVEEMVTTNITNLFFPHGLGHLLGIQVHDVGGHFKDDTGALAPPPDEYKYLRLTRPIEVGMVFTIEPGFYFIPTLLDAERESDKGKALNWKLIDELTPLGGIRIEDNILVTNDGARNLTRGAS